MAPFFFGKSLQNDFYPGEFLIRVQSKMLLMVLKPCELT